jgi:proteasome accessory factor B
MSDKSERLVNLTVALLEARRPLTYADIRRRTGYYAAGDESARRMFERDKDDLRRLGVPIETREDVWGAELGYIVDRRAYEMPDIHLTPDEVAALALALQVAGDGGSRLALTKLAARAPDPAELPTAVAGRLDVEVAAADAVADTVMERRTIRFQYRTAAGQQSTRTIDPYAVASRRSAWYVVGRDHDRDGIRAFRLDRVEGAIRTLSASATYDIPDDLDVSRHLTGPVEERIDVTVAVSPGLAYDAEMRGGSRVELEHRGWPIYSFASAQPWRTLAWALGHGPDVEVLTPAHVRDEVIHRLRAAAGTA